MSPTGRRFDRTFEAEFKRCQRSGAQLSVLFVDIDKFKAFNDTYGHSAGDDCIRRVARAIASGLKRPADLVARYGGEEFAILLPATTPANAERMAETVRKAVADLAIPHQASAHGHVTISVGLAGGKCEARTSTSSMLTAADEALYVAKEQGRNQVCVAADNPSLRLVRPAG